MTESEIGWRHFAVVIVVIVLGFSAFATISGYLDYSKEYWGQQQCVEKYGDGAEYVGEPSRFSSMGICEAGGDQHFIDVDERGMAPIGPFFSGGAT